jgi:hypothetical protein
MEELIACTIKVGMVCDETVVEKTHNYINSCLV